MIKLITPPGMLVTVAMLVIYSAYAFSIGSIESSWALLAGGALSMIAAYGVAVIRPWSQYLIYGLTLGFVAKLGASIYEGIASGYFGLQFGTVMISSRSLVPAFLMALLSIVCCAIVYRQFRLINFPR